MPLIPRPMCNPPGPHCHNSSERVSTRDSGAGGGRSNKERQRLQPLASVARAPLFEVRRVRFYTQPLLHSYIRYTHPPKPHSHPGHGTNVTPRVHILPQLVEWVSNPGFGAAGGRSNKERQRLQPLASALERLFLRSGE